MTVHVDLIIFVFDIFNLQLVLLVMLVIRINVENMYLEKVNIFYHLSSLQQISMISVTVMTYFMCSFIYYTEMLCMFR